MDNRYFVLKCIGIALMPMYHFFGIVAFALNLKVEEIYKQSFLLFLCLSWILFLLGLLKRQVNLEDAASYKPYVNKGINLYGMIVLVLFTLVYILGRVV